MVLLTRETVTGVIRDALQSASKAKLAVAFWGDQSLSLIAALEGKPVQLICNLESGACNPGDIKKLVRTFPGAVKSNPRLHAKLWWTAECVVIGSSNASANGLGLEGAATNGWLEANVCLTSPDAVASCERWFDEVWCSSESQPVTEVMITAAAALWATRRDFAREIEQLAAPGGLEESGSAPREGTWKGDVFGALQRLGGEGTLAAIYDMVHTIRREAGRSVPRSFKAVVRKELEYNSLDSDVFEGEDLFRMPRGKGAGYWALRKPPGAGAGSLSLQLG